MDKGELTSACDRYNATDDVQDKIKYRTYDTRDIIGIVYAHPREGALDTSTGTISDLKKHVTCMRLFAHVIPKLNLKF